MDRVKRLNSLGWSISVSILFLSSTIAVKTWANENTITNFTVAQAQFTESQIPDSSRFSNPSKLEYGARVRGRLGVRSLRLGGRRFELYQFEGKRQFIRINLVGGDVNNRPNNQLRTDSLLVNPILILLDPNGNIVAQQPEQANMVNALIRLTLPMTGKYSILVTSANIGTGGHYTLTLQQLRQDGSNSVIK